MYFRLNEKGNSLTVGICSKFPKYFVGGSRESFCLILLKTPKQPNSLISMYVKTCQGHIFLLYEQKDSSFTLSGTQLNFLQAPSNCFLLCVKESWSLWWVWRQKEESLGLLHASLSSMASPLSLLCSWALPSLNRTAPSSLGQPRAPATSRVYPQATL